MDQIWTRGVFYYYLDKYERIFEKNENCHNGGHFRPKMAAIFTKMVKILDKNGRHFGNFHFFQKSCGTYLDNNKIHLWSKFGPNRTTQSSQNWIQNYYFFVSEIAFIRGQNRNFEFSFEKIGWCDLDQLLTRDVFYDYLGIYQRLFEKNENCHNGGDFSSKCWPFLSKRRPF